MNPFKTMLSTAAFLVAGLTVSAQTADEIISKHLDAVGGKDKLSQLKSLVIEASINAMGNDAPANITMLVGKGYKMETELMGQKVVQAVTDKGGWAITPQTGGSAQATPDEQYNQAKSSLYADPFLDYAAHGFTVELQGTEGSDYKLALTNPSKTSTVYYINTTNYQIDKAVTTANMMGNAIDITTTFSDYKKSEFGITTAYSMEIAYGTMFSMTTTIKKVTVNSDIDPKVFDMPQ